MTNSTTTVVKTDASIDDHNRADDASDAFMIGIDAQGREHYFSRIRNCITVLDDGEHEHTEVLGDRPLSEWMAFVEQELGGWEENNTFSGSLVEHLCEQLAAGLTTGTRQ